MKSRRAGHVVLLCHDEMFRKPWEETELKQLIDHLRSKGYRLAHLSEYPAGDEKAGEMGLAK